MEYVRGHERARCYDEWNEEIPILILQNIKSKLDARPVCRPVPMLAVCWMT